MNDNYFQETITCINLNENYSTIIFQVSNFNWQDQHLQLFVEKFFELLTSAQLIEMIEGADRLQIRFDYQQEAFVLNLECNCESIWIESYVHNHESLLRLMFEDINRQIAKELR
ncbi:DUF3630 family protein [Thalassotalea piscium]